MMVGASSQDAQRPWLAILLSSPTPLGPRWTGVPPDAGALTGVGPSSVAMAELRSRTGGFDGLLHVRKCCIHGLFSLDCGVGIILDCLGNSRVERRHGTRNRVIDRRLQDRQVR